MNQPPTVPVMNVSPTSAGPAQIVSFSASSSDPEGGAVSYQWDFGNGSSATGSTTTHAYANPGSYSVTVTASDAHGATSRATQTVSIVNQLPSVPAITVGGSVFPVGSSVAMTASSTDPEGQALTYSWQFGDATTGSGNSVNHIYRVVGSVTLTVTVTDPHGGSRQSSTTLTITNAAPAVPVINVSTSSPILNSAVQMTASSTDPEGQPLVFSWQFGDGMTTTGSSVSHAYTAFGNYTVSVGVSDPQGATSSATTVINVTNRAPSLPNIVVSSQSVAPGVAVSFSATSSDPEAQPLSFAWSFGDGVTGSGSPASHAYAVEGVYAARVTVTDSAGAASTNTIALTVGTPAPVGVTATPTVTQLYPKQILEWTGSATDPTGLPLTYSWNFGDGNTASGPAARHSYSAAGAYNVVLTARNSANRATTVTVPIQVLIPAQSAPLDNTWRVYCSGPLCGAVDGNTYAGRGVGVWRYHNAQVSPASLAIRIGGVSSGQSASLVFSNGTTTDSTSLPSSGIATSSSTPSQKVPRLLSKSDSLSARLERAQHAHRWKVEDNLRFAQSQPIKLSTGDSQKSLVSELPSVVRKLPPPALGTIRVWRANFTVNGTPYTAAVVATCELPTGRYAVFWLEQTMLALPAAASNIERLRATYCGPSANPALGSYGRLVQMVGDVYGSNVNANPAVIQETPGALQDFNIVVFNPPATEDWSGFASAGDVYWRTPLAQYRNEALMVGFNGFYFRDVNFANFVTSSLVHETMHMINHYQRELSRQKFFSAFLEETIAMMAEDLIPPVVLASLGVDFYRTESRFSSVLYASDLLSYTNWNSPMTGTLYGIGATFGTTLHRRYGASVLPQLLQCDNDPLTNGSWTCLDQVIRANGGNGVADEYALMGAAFYGLVSDRNLPWGIGFPATQVNEFRLLSLWPGAYKNVMPLRVMPMSSFLAASHGYDRVVIANGQTEFARSNVVVPPNTTVTLVVTTLADF